jgi:hypothetical protein
MPAALLAMTALGHTHARKRKSEDATSEQEMVMRKKVKKWPAL